MLIDGYYTLREAAAYLGTSPSNVAKHLYILRDLQPDKTLNGRLLLFSQATLDEFKRTWRRSNKGTPALDTESKV